MGSRSETQVLNKYMIHTQTTERNLLCLSKNVLKRSDKEHKLIKNNLKLFSVDNNNKNTGKGKIVSGVLLERRTEHPEPRGRRDDRSKNFSSAY